ncbi:pyrroline-5-carboxylate reductase [Georgenia sunbinii]|uniref:pyrroline-5-carboxylate reductase n=1 Tax=Georgenia sunbinii TaxID=3117728 RepID=UPI002F26974D
MTIGFIGAGNMAGAIIRGLVAAEVVTGRDILVHDVSPQAAQDLARETGASVASSASSLVAGSEVVVLAVKPQVVAAVLRETGETIAGHRPLIVSIAAGTTLATLAGHLPAGKDVPVVRVMPNVNAMIGAGVAAVCGNEAATAADLARVQEIFAAVGEVVELPEKDFSTFTALAGSGPAFVFTFIDALARGGVMSGMPKKLATLIAAQTVLGSAQLVLDSAEDGHTPADLVDMVSSPAGTTVAGLVAMEQAGFSPAVVRAVQATVARGDELAG